MVFRRGAEHCRAANVDIFDKRCKIVGLRALRLERIEIDRQQVDPANPLIVHCGQMIVIVAARQQAAMNFRMERLYPPVHDFGKACDLGDIRDLDPGLAEGFRGAACRKNVVSRRDKAAGKFDQSGLVGNGK